MGLFSRQKLILSRFLLRVTARNFNNLIVNCSTWNLDFDWFFWYSEDTTLYKYHALTLTLMRLFSRQKLILSRFLLRVTAHNFNNLIANRSVWNKPHQRSVLTKYIELLRPHRKLPQIKLEFIKSTYLGFTEIKYHLQKANKSIFNARKTMNDSTSPSSQRNE